MRKDGFVGEDAVEGRAADVELAGGAEPVAAAELEDVFNMVADDGVERERLSELTGGCGAGGVRDSPPLRCTCGLR